MKLDDVQEKDLSAARVLPAQGKWHPGTISVAEPGLSGKGSPMIKLQVVLNGEGHEGYTIYHNFMTDGSTKGGSFSKKQLMGCGIDVNKEQPDEEVAQQLLGKDVFVQVRHEVIKDKDDSGNYTKIRYDVDEDGKDVPAKKAVAVGFSLYDPSSQKAEKAPEKETPARAEEKPAEGKPAEGKPTPPWMKKKA